MPVPCCSTPVIDASGIPHLGCLRPWKACYSKRWRLFCSTPGKDIPRKQLNFKLSDGYYKPFWGDPRVFASLPFWKKNPEFKAIENMWYRPQEANLACWSILCHAHQIIFLVIFFYQKPGRIMLSVFTFVNSDCSLPDCSVPHIKVLIKRQKKLLM